MTARLLIFSCVFLASAANAEQIKIAAWNIYWLGDSDPRGVSRQDSHFNLLRGYAEALDADVIALQEVATERHALRVFPGHRIEISKQPGNKLTGFAIKPQVTYRRNPDYEKLDTTGKLKWGTDITIDVGSRSLRLLSVHLKARCLDEPLESRPGCKKLQNQIPVLEAWTDPKLSAGENIIVLGDFNRWIDIPRDEFWRDLGDTDPAPLRQANLRRRPNCWGGRAGHFVSHFVMDEETASWITDFDELVYSETDYEAWHRYLSNFCPIWITLDVPNPVQ